MAAIPHSDPFGCFVGAPVRQGGAGLVVAIKDNIDMAGLPTGAGLGRPGPLATIDAPVVARLRAAGFALLGKTRMDEAAFGATGDNPHHGCTQNPAAPGHSPGGSSGGSAAAVAARLADAALGTDTLGSIRIPAAYCGLLGLKPTRGVLPMQGVTPLSPSMDHVGILARDPTILAAILRLFLAEPPAAAAGRIGVPTELSEIPIDPAVRAAFEAALKSLAARGWQIAPCTIANWQPESLRRAALLLIEAEGAKALADLVNSEDPALSTPTRHMLRYGRDCSPTRLAQATQTLQTAATSLQNTLKTCDLIALPTVAAPAYPQNTPPPPNQATLAALANYGGFPAISIPLPTQGNPIGLQLIAAPNADWRLIQTANHFFSHPSFREGPGVGPALQQTPSARDNSGR